jgi:hypothetical protein
MKKRFTLAMLEEAKRDLAWDDFRAIVDYNEAIRLNPNYGVAFCNRGIA